MKSLRLLLAILALGLVGCNKDDTPVKPDTSIKSLGTPPNNEIWFTTNDGRELITLNEEAFGVAIEDISYTDWEYNTIRFAAPLTEIGDGAFDNCRNLFNISLPDSVTRIGEEAFFECVNMECLTLGNGLRECGAYAFDSCYNLHTLYSPAVYCWCNIAFANSQANPAVHSGRFIVNGNVVRSLVIPSQITSISRYAFYELTALSDVTVPVSVTTIGKDAFYGCDGITKVKIEDLGAWCNIAFESETANPLSLAQKLYLADDTELRDLSLIKIDNISSRAFINCTSITSLTSDDTLRKVGLEAFRNCTSLTTITLGESITELGERAFMGCSKLSNVTCLATVPPQLKDKYTFAYTDKNIQIAVPSKAYEAYLADPMWSQYADQIVKLQN